jgi:competence protein ComGC
MIVVLLVASILVLVIVSFFSEFSPSDRKGS